METNIDARKLKWQHKARNTPKTGLPAIADRAVWEKATKRASWNKVE